MNFAFFLTDWQKNHNRKHVRWGFALNIYNVSYGKNEKRTHSPTNTNINVFVAQLCAPFWRVLTVNWHGTLLPGIIIIIIFIPSYNAVGFYAIIASSSLLCFSMQKKNWRGSNHKNLDILTKNDRERERTWNIKGRIILSFMYSTDFGFLKCTHVNELSLRVQFSFTIKKKVYIVFVCAVKRTATKVKTSVRDLRLHHIIPYSLKLAKRKRRIRLQKGKRERVPWVITSERRRRATVFFALSLSLFSV